MQTNTLKKTIIMLGLGIVLLAPAAAMACACQGNQYRTGTGAVTMEEAGQITTNYLNTIDSRLTAGKIRLEGQTYLVDVNDAEGNPVAKLSIDMLTGAIKPVF